MGIYNRFTSLSVVLMLHIVQSTSFSHSIFTASDSSRNISFESKTLIAFLKCLRCDKVSRCTADYIFNNKSGSNYRIKTVGKHGHDPIETFRTCSIEADTLICQNLPTPTLTCVRNITILNSSLIDGCSTQILSVNINESQVRFNLDNTYFNITTCETLNVSLRSLTPQTTITVPISDSNSTVGIIVGAIIVCGAIIICCFLWRRRANKVNKSTTSKTEHHHYFEIELDASVQHKKRKEKTESNMRANSVNPYAITPCNGYTSSNLHNKCNILTDTHKDSAVVSNTSLKNDITQVINTDNYHAHYYSMPKDETDPDICYKDINHMTMLDRHVDACKTDTPQTNTAETDTPKTNTAKTDTPNVYSHLGQTKKHFTEPYDDIASYDAKRK